MTNNPYFGILLSYGCYLVGVKINQKFKTPVLNPLLIGIVLTIAVLVGFGIDFETYNMGAKYITFLIAPTTVALMVELYKNLDILKKDIVPIIVGIVVGSIVAVSSTLILCKVFGLSEKLTTSFIPHAVTTAIGMPLSEQNGGNPTLTIITIMLSGILGATIGPDILKVLGIKSSVAKGIAIGTASHAVGTAKANEMGEIEGAMSGLSIGLAGLVTVVLMPIVLKFL
ncbi:LrgB family protein [Peptoniphilus asaccharolyticus]